VSLKNSQISFQLARFKQNMAAEQHLTVSAKITSLPQSTKFPMITRDKTPNERLPRRAQFV